MRLGSQIRELVDGEKSPGYMTDSYMSVFLGVPRRTIRTHRHNEGIPSSCDRKKIEVLRMIKEEGRFLTDEQLSKVTDVNVHTIERIRNDEGIPSADIRRMGM